MQEVIITLTAKAEDGQHEIWWNDELSHHVHEDESQEMLSTARQGLWRNSAEDGAALGQHLFYLLNGNGGHLERTLKDSFHQGTPLHLRLDIPFEFDALPFELLSSPSPNLSRQGRGTESPSPNLSHQGRGTESSPPLVGGAGRGGTTFLLLNPHPQIHLTRRVTTRKKGKSQTPKKEMLTALFMACSPRNTPEQQMLRFEQEEEHIWNAVEKFQLDLQVEDSGSRQGLQDALIEFGSYDEAQKESRSYDIVHLSGHAGIDHKLGPVFYMEDEVGNQEKVPPAELWQALRDFPPRVLFLSGCSTGKSDKVNAVESFAWQMVKQGIPIVLGWGLPVSDSGATLMAAEVYKLLGMGKSVHEAVQRARQELAERHGRYHPWPLLRIFTDGSKPASLIAPGQKLRRRTRRAATHKYLKDSQVRVLDRGFVGRRREIQDGVRVLRGATEQYGLLIHGTAGVGKSCLAGKLIDRFPDKELIVLHGELKAHHLFRQLRDLFDKRGHQAAMDILNNTEVEVEGKLKALFRGPFQDIPTLLYVDDFEQNLELHGDEYHVRPEARELLIPLLTALEWSEGQTNLIITNRYPFVLEVAGENLPNTRLHDISLMSMRKSDLKKSRMSCRILPKARM